jgi:hypothetical protein
MWHKLMNYSKKIVEDEPGLDPATVLKIQKLCKGASRAIADVSIQRAANIDTHDLVPSARLPLFVSFGARVPLPTLSCFFFSLSFRTISFLVFSA